MQKEDKRRQSGSRHKKHASKQHGRCGLKDATFN